jgi:hypothetical protein
MNRGDSLTGFVKYMSSGFLGDKIVRTLLGLIAVSID